MTYLAQIYPELADEKPDYAWEGLFAETPDGLPYIGEHSRYPRHLFALGYGGNGMTASFLAAQTLVDLYQRRDKGGKTRRIGNLFAFDRGAGNLAATFPIDPGSPSTLRAGGSMKRTRNFYVGVTIAAVIAVLAIAQYTLQTVARAQENGSANRAGIYEVDRMWPKPLPNNWVLGSTVGLAIDARDHVFIVHRGQASLDPEVREPDGVRASRASRRRRPRGRRSRAAAGFAAPSAGNTVAGYSRQRHDASRFPSSAARQRLRCSSSIRKATSVSHWGAPGAGYEWPPSMHGITIDGKDNVWLAGNGGNTVLKFSKDGKFLLQIGKNGASKGNKDTANLSRPAEVEVDMAANEVYVADGYGNRRVIVYDADKGTFKRMWGAYGKPPTDDPNVTYDPAKPLSTNWQTVHCASLANDGLVYVCDRVNDRIQVFQQGRHVHQGSADCQADARRRRHLRHRVLEGPAAAADVCG